MEATREFRRLGMMLLQGDVEKLGDPEAFMNEVSALFLGEERVRLQRFLDEVLASGASDGELDALWSATPSDAAFYGSGSLRRFLALVRDTLAGPRPRDPGQTQRHAKPRGRPAPTRRGR